jgi:hypothetical protein
MRLGKCRLDRRRQPLVSSQRADDDGCESRRGARTQSAGVGRDSPRRVGQALPGRAGRLQIVIAQVRCDSSAEMVEQEVTQLRLREVPLFHQGQHP